MLPRFLESRQLRPLKLILYQVTDPLEKRMGLKTVLPLHFRKCKKKDINTSSQPGEVDEMAA